MTTTTTKSNGRHDIQRIVRAKRGIVLDIGCARGKQPGAVGMDKQALPDVDIVHDWDVFPWPLEDESVLTIIASQVVTRVNPAGGHFIDWMNECWRVLKPGGQMAIVAPYGLSSLYIQDPTFCNPVNEKTWWYFDGDHADSHGGSRQCYWDYYKPRPWKTEECFFSAEGQLEVSLRKRATVPDAWLATEETTT